MQRAQAVSDYKVWHFNMCGNVCEGGDDTTNESSDPVTAIKNSLTASGDNQDLVSLNEVCFNQYSKLMSVLPTAWHGNFTLTLHKEDYGGLCDDNAGDGQEHDYGIAVLVRGPLVAGSQIDYPLPTGDTRINEVRHLSCVTADLATKQRLCSTHIAPLSVWTNLGYSEETAKDKQRAQITEVRQKAESFNYPTVVMGDFNAEPTIDRLDQMYDAARYGGGASGIHQEIHDNTPTASYNFTPPCRCGAYTHSKSNPHQKIDYIFFRKTSYSRVSGSVTSPVTDSDHLILRGAIRI